MLVAQKANVIPLRRGVTSREKNVIVPLCSALREALFRALHSALGPTVQENIELLEKVRKRAMKTIRRLKNLSY